MEVNRLKMGLVQKLHQLVSEEAAVKKRVYHIQNEIEDVQEQIFNAPAEQKQIIDLRKQKEVLEKLQISLQTTMQTSRIHLMSLNSNFELLERAVPMPFSISPGLGRYIVVGFAMGLVLAVSIVLLLKFWENTLKSSVDLKRNFHYPSLGVLPEWRGDEMFIDEMQPDSRISEVFGMLRNAIRFSSTTNQKNAF